MLPSDRPRPLRRHAVHCRIEALEFRRLLTAFFVSTTGSDGNLGTSLGSPFRTIQQAVNAALPGDTVFVRGGTYRETVSTPRSGTAAARITIESYQGEAVKLSGTDGLPGPWTSVGNEVYRAPMAWNYQFENQSAAYNSNQLFFGGAMMHLARWPDQTNPDLLRPSNAIADNIIFSKSNPALASNDLATITDAQFTDSPTRWIGARIWVNLSRPSFDGQGQTGTVVAASANSITVTGIDTRGGLQAWGIGTGTEYYLFQPTLASLNASGGIAAGIDRGEWFLDTSAQQVYVRTPAGLQPGSDSVEAKRRTFAFNLDGDSFITLRRFNLFATSLTTDSLSPNRNVLGGVAAASNILIDAFDVQHVTHFTDQAGNYQMQWPQKSGLILSGSDIVLSNSTFRYSSGSGVSIIGRRNKVLQSVFRDLNLAITDAGVINFGKTFDPGPFRVVSEDHEFAHNHIYDSPQQGINIRGLQSSTNSPTDARARIHHNLIHDVMLRAFDSGAIDSAGINHQFIRIDHNVIFNVVGELNFGIYFDFSSSAIIDHNVVYNVTNPININWDPSAGPQNMWVLNNTAISSNPALPGLGSLADASVGSVIRNNILSASIYTPTGATVSNNLVSASALFVDAINPAMASRNFQLALTAAGAINQGVSVPPYNDPAVGPPDLGAYEYGLPPWRAGANESFAPAFWTVSGRTYRDGNRNSIPDAADPPLPNRTVYLDMNNNGVFDSIISTNYNSSGPPNTIPDGNPAGGQRRVTISAATGLITDLDITFSISHASVRDLTADLIAPDGTILRLFTRIGGFGDNFTSTTLDDSATSPISSGAAPFTGRFRPVGAGGLAIFNGRSPNGIWRLRVIDSAPVDVGTITAFSMSVATAGDIPVATASDGTYAFYNIPSAVYNVRQILPPNWSAVSPASAHTVTLIAGTSATGRDFGSYENSTPTLVESATATPAAPPLGFALTTLAAFAADPNGEPNLAYSWSTLAKPPSAPFPVFSATGSNAAKSTTTALAVPGQYTFRVTITNAGGASVTSDVSLTVPVLAPASPTNATAFSSISATSVSLSWIDNSENETGFRVDRSTAADFSTNLVVVAATAPGTTSLMDSSVAPETTYFYRVTATGAAGDSPPSNSASARTVSAWYVGKGILLPGQPSTFANYSNHAAGLTGVVFDLPLAASSLSPADISFKVGNTTFPSTWPVGPTPTSLVVQPGAGEGGVARAEIIFPGGSIINRWLQVTVHSTSATGLAQPFVFYFGAAPGELNVNNLTTRALVNASDAQVIRQNFTASAPPGNTFDINRDGRTDNTDVAFVLANTTTFATALILWSPPLATNPRSGPAVTAPPTLPRPPLRPKDDADRPTATVPGQTQPDDANIAWLKLHKSTNPGLFSTLGVSPSATRNQ